MKSKESSCGIASAPGETVTLVTDDEQQFVLSAEVAKLMVTITNLLEDMDSGSKEAPIPVPNISSKTMKKVVEFCSYHYEHRVEEGISFTSKDCFDRDFVVISEWDKEFFNVPAANYLDIKLLLDIGCKIIAQMIIGKSPEEIRKTFHTREPTSQEEEAIRKENAWLFEE